MWNSASFAGGTFISIRRCSMAASAVSMKPSMTSPRITTVRPGRCASGEPGGGASVGICTRSCPVSGTSAVPVSVVGAASAGDNMPELACASAQPSALRFASLIGISPPGRSGGGELGPEPGRVLVAFGEIGVDVGDQLRLVAGEPDQPLRIADDVLARGGMVADPDLLAGRVTAAREATVPEVEADRRDRADRLADRAARPIAPCPNRVAVSLGVIVVIEQQGIEPEQRVRHVEITDAEHAAV